MLKIGETLSIERIPKKFTAEKLDIDFTGVESISDLVFSNRVDNLDEQVESERLGKKSRAFMYTVMYERMQTFLRLLENAKTLEERMLDKSDRPDTTSHELIAIHRQIMSRLVLEMNLHKPEEGKGEPSVPNIYNITTNKILNVKAESSDQKTLETSSEVSPVARKAINMVMDKFKNAR